MRDCEPFSTTVDHFRDVTEMISWPTGCHPLLLQPIRAFWITFWKFSQGLTPQLW